MIRKGNKWYSAFPPNEGESQVIPNNSGILAVTANEGLFGGHAAMLLESVDQNGDARVRFIHLTAGIEGLELALERTGSGSAVSYTPSADTSEITISITNIKVDKKYLDLVAKLDYQSFVVTSADADAVIREAEEFRREVEAGKYVYRKYGGKLAKLTSPKGKDGVNCADFCIIVLQRAKIANLENRLINTPIRVAGGRRRKKKKPK
jgi:hypothetical protein